MTAPSSSVTAPPDVAASNYRRYWQEQMSASSIAWHEPFIIPGLFQTTAYTTALLRRTEPTWTQEAVAQMAAHRQDLRDHLLPAGGPRPRITVVIGEGALRNVVGDARVMATQLRYLASIAAERLELHVLPFKFGPFSGALIPYVIIDARAEANAGSAAAAAAMHAENGFDGAVYHGHTVDQFRASFYELADQALAPDGSRQFILKVASEFAEASRATRRI
jgi:hypothetical protein